MAEIKSKKQAKTGSNQDGRPDWVPLGAGPEFAVSIVKGVMRSDRVKAVGATKPRTRRRLSAQEYIAGVRAGDRTILARAITLIESHAAHHRQLAQAVLSPLLPLTGRSLRIGISGLPGAGKSTLIEILGNQLVAAGHRLAVLAVDPSSTLTRGSILGDKTRMETLARHPACFIRPSPSGGTLGGVARKSRETILLCEAAGYDIIFVETVGVGQNEVTVRSMVDFFLLVMIAGGGDELQGIKKGVMEIADAVLVNKADGENLLRAEKSKTEYNLALGLISSPSRGWQTRAHICSALTGQGVAELWQMVQTFQARTMANGFFAERRKNQAVEWFRTMLNDSLKDLFFQHAQVCKRMPALEAAVARGDCLVTEAVYELIKLFIPAGQDKPSFPWPIGK